MSQTTQLTKLAVFIAMAILVMAPVGESILELVTSLLGGLLGGGGGGGKVWEHFDKEDLPSGMQAICKYCGMSYKCGAKKNGTSVLWAHISRCRKYPFNTPKDSKQSLLSFKSAKEPSGGTSGLTYHKFDAGSIRKALSFMVIVDELPFKFVEGVIQEFL
uniref:BED-type domain-containing protein n=1 Tax=Chenopodium quinoa TaxID=63459 RepID=A0A803MQA4_CHEQI